LEVSGNYLSQGKSKIHGWGILMGFIPCKGALFNRHIVDNSYCVHQARKILWRYIEDLAHDRNMQQMLEEIIKGGRKVPSLNNVGPGGVDF